VITRLAGTLLEVDLTHVTVDVHGVGFAVTVPMSTYDRLPRPGSEVVLHTFLDVRENEFELFGFWTVEERQLFLLLTGVSGIGPRLGLNILSGASVDVFCQTLADGDVKALCRVKGIGKRVAERLVVELREKVKDIAPGAGFGGGPGLSDALGKEAQDAVTALVTLGFKHDAARRAVAGLVDSLPAKEQTAEQFIRRALQNLNR